MIKSHSSSVSREMWWLRLSMRPKRSKKLYSGTYEFSYSTVCLIMSLMSLLLGKNMHLGRVPSFSACFTTFGGYKLFSKSWTLRNYLQILYESEKALTLALSSPGVNMPNSSKELTLLVKSSMLLAAKSSWISSSDLSSSSQDVFSSDDYMVIVTYFGR